MHKERGPVPAASPQSLAQWCAHTTAGGLLFLIPVLQRLGYQQWLDAQPEWIGFDIAHRLMAMGLNRLHVPPDDPAWLLTAYRRTAKRAPRRFIAPERWREGLCMGEGNLRAAEKEGACTLWDPSARLLLGAWIGSCPRTLTRVRRLATADPGILVGADRVHLVTTAWLIASRRWLRRYAGMGLSHLLLRPAAMALTPTHADLCLDINLAELSVRRAGLDIDPGWVRWFGRVVTFRYRS
jgi:hypothetical protein